MGGVPWRQTGTARATAGCWLHWDFGVRSVPSASHLYLTEPSMYLCHHSLFRSCPMPLHPRCCASDLTLRLECTIRYRRAPEAEHIRRDVDRFNAEMTIIENKRCLPCSFIFGRIWES